MSEPLNHGPELDEKGYLLDRSHWSQEWAVRTAAVDGIVLTSEHWDILWLLQRYHDEFESAPPMRLLLKEITSAFGPERGNSRYLYRLFPQGPAKQACRYAGLPKPVSCI